MLIIPEEIYLHEWIYTYTGEREGWREELREEENLILGKTEG